MELVSLVIQSAVGFLFLINFICLLLLNRKRETQTKAKWILSLACIFVGVFLLGYILCKIL